MTKMFRVSICVLLLALFAAAQQPDNTPIEPMDQTPDLSRKRGFPDD